MGRQDFPDLVSSGVLGDVESIVVDAVRAGKLSRPQAYRWLRYEDPDPVARLAEGVEKLRRKGARFDAGAVDKACARASQAGFLN